MILKRYGSQLHSVTPRFDAKAMNEIGFQRSNEHSVTTDEFNAGYEQAAVHELTAAADADVQMEAETRVLEQLADRLNELQSSLKDGEVLVIESEAGRDYPKTREQVNNVIIDGANRLHFFWTIDPPLRVAVYRSRQT